MWRPAMRRHGIYNVGNHRPEALMHFPEVLERDYFKV
jgi:hypothetical protein